MLEGLVLLGIAVLLWLIYVIDVVANKIAREIWGVAEQLRGLRSDRRGW